MHTIKTIRLEDLKFYAFHGAYAEEQKTGNNFIVNIAVSQTILHPLTENLDETVDYTKLYKIVATEMRKRSDLLEDVLQRILNTIEHQIQEINSIKIEIKKLTPAIGGNCGASVVEIERQYHK